MNLTTLDDYIRKNGSDLVAFNAYVQSQVDGLAARNETTQDLIVNLFKGYKAVTYQPFLDYLQVIENGHEDGSAVITAFTLMILIRYFYKNKLTRDEWEKPSETQQEMLALQSKVESFQQEVKTLRKKQAQSKLTVPDQDNKSKIKQGSQKPSWLTNHTKPNPEDLTKSLTWKGKSWWFCDKSTGGKCKGQWRAHKPIECKGLMVKWKPKDKQAQKRAADALKLTHANEALMKAARNGDDSE